MPEGLSPEDNLRAKELYKENERSGKKLEKAMADNADILDEHGMPVGRSSTVESMTRAREEIDEAMTPYYQNHLQAKQHVADNLDKYVETAKQEMADDDKPFDDGSSKVGIPETPNQP